MNIPKRLEFCFPPAGIKHLEFCPPSWHKAPGILSPLSVISDLCSAAQNRDEIRFANLVLIEACGASVVRWTTCCEPTEAEAEIRTCVVEGCPHPSTKIRVILPDDSYFY